MTGLRDTGTGPRTTLGWPWQCAGCGWTNRSRETECDGCGENRATAELSRADLVAVIKAIPDAVAKAAVIGAKYTTRKPAA